VIRKSYSIHNIVRFDIIDRSQFHYRLIDKTKIQFENFETSQDTDPDFIVEVGPFTRSRNKCFILDDSYFIDDGYFYCRDKRKFARWELEVSDIDCRPTIRINTNFAGYYTAPLNIIEFFIHYTLLKKGRVLIHASGIEKDDQCYLFSARGGGGKTTVALSLTDKGYKYLGDNFILLDKGKARSFISPLNIFSYNRLDIIERNLSRKQKVSVTLKELIYKLTGGYIKIFEKINPSTFFPEQIINESALSHICILEPNSDVSNKNIVVQDIDTKTLIKKLRYNMELDLQLFSKYMYSYAYINTDSFWGSFWDKYEQALADNLSNNMSAYIIQVPMRYNLEFILQLMEATKLRNAYCLQ